MCCILDFIGKLVSNVLYFSEKFLYCFTCSALVSCVVTTIVLTLGMGIGIGYNYCFVNFHTTHRYVPARFYYPDKKYHPDNKHYPGFYPEYNNEANFDSNYNPHFKRSTPTYVTASGDTDNVNDLQATDSSILTRNKNESQPHNNTNNTEQSHNNKNNKTMENMHDNKDQVIQTNKQTSTEKPPDDSPNLIVPISGLDLIALLSKFRSENRNYSLQIVTT